jgi:RHS repeat-associated protein
MTQTGGIITNYAYDGRGNLTAATQGGNVTSYTWDKADRLTGVTLPGSGGNQSYKYDHANRRVQVISGIATTNYLWDEQSAYGDVLIEADNSWNIQTTYTLGNGELIGQNRSSTLSYYLMDGHSGVRGLTNSSVSLTDSYAYGAFGDLKNSSGTTANNYRYTGQQFDNLTGLYSLRARYYNPNEGRFLSRDTWGVNLVNPIELNRYGYVANNPSNASDPSGLFVDTVATKQTVSISNKASLAILGITTACLIVRLVVILYIINRGFLEDKETTPLPFTIGDCVEDCSSEIKLVDNVDTLTGKLILTSYLKVSSDKVIFGGFVNLRLVAAPLVSIKGSYFEADTNYRDEKANKPPSKILVFNPYIYPVRFERAGQNIGSLWNVQVQANGFAFFLGSSVADYCRFRCFSNELAVNGPVATQK